jgi:hypothetical protein
VKAIAYAERLEDVRAISRLTRTARAVAAGAARPPYVPPGHFHSPLTSYPETWLREHRDWTGAYLVQAFLPGNSDRENPFFSSWLWHRHREAVPPRLLHDSAPGSLWLRKTR